MKVKTPSSKPLPVQKKSNRPASISVDQTNELAVPAPSRRLLSWLLNIWVFIPALLFLKVASENVVNIPIEDDYDAILDFIHNYKSAPFIGKIGLLFGQYNEHRLFYSHILYATYYSLFGEINFRNIALIGDLQLVVVFMISIYFIRKVVDKYWGIFAFIWGLCIFDLNTYWNSMAAMGGIQNYGIVMLFFITLFLYSLNRKYLIPAALFQVICIYSSGNGMLASLVVAIYTLFGDDKVKKIVSLSIAVFFSPLYFLHYTPNITGLEDPAGFNPGTAVTFFIKMVGDPLEFDGALLLGLLALILLAAVFPYKSIRSKSNVLPVVAVAAFCLMSMATASIFRSNLKGAVPNSSRYLLYPQILLAALSFFLFLKFKGRKAQLPVMIVTSAIMLKVYMGNYAFGKAGFERENLRAKTRTYYHPDQAKAKRIAQQAKADDVYNLEEERW